MTAKQNEHCGNSHGDLFVARSEWRKDGVRYGHNPEHYRTAVKKDLLLDLLDVFVVEAIK